MERASYQTRLQKIVLAWDFYQLDAIESAREKAGANRDGGGGDETAAMDLLGGESELLSVPSEFKSHEDYTHVYEKLLLEECKSQILRGNEDYGPRHCDKALMASVEKANEFHFAKLAVKEEVASDFSENDLLLLSKEQPMGGATPSTYALAVVESREGVHGGIGAVVKVRFFLSAVNVDNVEGAQDSKRQKTSARAAQQRAARLVRVQAELQQPNSLWWLMKLCSLSTITREYTALYASANLPFLDVILNGGDLGRAGAAAATSAAAVKDGATGGATAAAAASANPCRAIPPALDEWLESRHNPSQLGAIKASLTRDPVVLIQGPPGTGKTQTILGLLSVVLHSTPLRSASRRHGLSGHQRRAELTPEERAELWLRGAPWMAGGENARDLNLPIDGDAGEGDVPLPKLHETQSVGSKRQQRAHVLVCAPSNAALDEVIYRLINDGLKDENGVAYKPNVVRVGLNAHHSVEAVTMDVQVAQRVSSMQRTAAGPGAGTARMQKDRLRVAVLDQAAIVCSTLSFSGSGIFSRMSRGFDVVIVDEAAQAVEPSTLIPLSYGCRQLFLVGDPLQLPATVISAEAVKHRYGLSMFKRLQEVGFPVQMLKTQYRMHPLIRQFPSEEFYDGSLEDGPNVVAETSKPWHEFPCFGPFAFFDVDGRESQPKGSGSWVNTDEASFALQMYRHLALKYPQIKEKAMFAVISPYRHQVKLIRTLFKEALPEQEYHLIDINTVDGFQGRERDIAIFSCVRADKNKGIGFVKDSRRMNVGLTRARSSMLVLGCAAALKVDKHWRNLVKHSKATGTYFKVTRPLHAFFSDGSLEEIKRQAAEMRKAKRDDDAQIARAETGVGGEEDEEGGGQLQDVTDDMIDEMMENQGLLGDNDLDVDLDGLDMGEEGLDLAAMEDDFIEEKGGWLESVDGEGFDQDE